MRRTLSQVAVTLLFLALTPVAVNAASCRETVIANPEGASKWLESVLLYLREANSWISRSDQDIDSGTAQVTILGQHGRLVPVEIPAAASEDPVLRGIRAMQSGQKRLQRIAELGEWSIAEGGLGLFEFTGLRDVALMSDENVGNFAEGLLGCKLLLTEIVEIEKAIAKHHQGPIDLLSAEAKSKIVAELLSPESSFRPTVSEWRRRPEFSEAFEAAKQLPPIYKQANHHRDAWRLIMDRYLYLVEAVGLGLREDFPEIVTAIANSHSF